MRILVTAGPTREPLDPVRFLSNRSTGKMGYAVARAARRRGHAVRLVTGPAAFAPPRGMACIRVLTARDMLEAVREHVPWCDALVMAAAVCDWRPARPSARKIKKRGGPPALRLVANPDILKALRGRKGGRLFVGFAAETGDPAAEGERKRIEKGLDMVVANDVSRSDAGFEADTNRAVFLTARGRDRLPLMSKSRMARRLVAWIEAEAASRLSSPTRRGSTG